MTAWGTGSYGTGAYGAAATLTVLSALATSERTVVVTLSRPVRHTNPIGVGDGLNPACWDVTRGDDGSSLIVLATRMLGSPSVWELFTLKRFGTVNVTHTAAGVGLVGVNGVLLTAPSSATFSGIEAAPIDHPQDDVVADLRNAQTTETSLAGALQVTASGDYARESGAALVRKLVLRRITTDPSAFFHLRRYGAGLRTKAPVPESDLPQIQAELTRQVALEPEIEAASVTLELDRAGILYIAVKGRLRSGETFDEAFPLPTSVQL